MASNVSKVVRLYIHNLPWTVTSREVCEYFSKFGDIKRAAVFFDKNTGFSTNYGYILVKDSETLDNIERVRRHTLEGNTLFITTQQEKREAFHKHVEI